MTLDFPHMIVTALIVLAVIRTVDRIRILQRASRGRRTLIKLAAIFAAIVILNLLWPYGATA